MGKKSLFILFYSLLTGITACAQCINSDSLWRRLIYLRDSSANSPQQDLQELLHYKGRAEQCTLKNDTSYALLLQRIGAAYNQAGDYLQAEKYVKKAIQTITYIPGRRPVNESQLIRNYYLLSLIYLSTDRTNDKIQAEDSCIAISLRSNSTDIRVLPSLIDKVEYLFGIGDYHQTINYAKEGEIITSKILSPEEQLPYLFNFLIWKVNSLVYLEKYDDAEKLLNENLKTFTSGGPNDFKGIILGHMGEIKTKKGHFTEALDYYKKSLQCDKIQKNFSAILKTYGIMGSYLYDEKLHDDAKALACYREALRYASIIFKLPNHNDSIEATIATLEIYNLMANIQDKKWRFDSASYYFQKGFNQIGITAADKNFTDHINKEFLQNKGIPSLIKALIDQADSYLRQYKQTPHSYLLNKASSLYANADKLQYIIKNEQTAMQSQLFWRNYLRRLYEHAIETSELLGNMEDVFNYFEKSRAVLLNDQLKKQLSLNKNDNLKIGLIKMKILDLNRTLKNLDPSTSAYSEIHNELFNYNGDLATLELQIQKHNPAYLKAIEDTGTIHLKEVQQIILKDHDALLELFDGDSAVYLLIITPKQVCINQISKSDFEKTSGDYISYISDPSMINSHFDQFIEVAKHLYQIIFNRCAIPTGRIIISPDGRYFPFEALITKSKLSQPDYFLEDHAVSYTYSARYLLYNFSISSLGTNSKDFLGFAPVQFANFTLDALPGSDESLKKIERFYNYSNILKSEEATKTKFLENFSKYKIIQLYTHSSDSSVLGEPVIYFSDSAMYLSDLISLDKPASQLIVLSACETSNGKLYQGEGVFSFNRGFAALGIPASITNLWSVDNESTYKLTELFYKYVSKGIPLDISLQKAKLEFITSSTKGKKMPYYWAAAIIAGKTDAIEMNKGFQGKWLSLIGDFFLMFLAFFVFRKMMVHK